MMICAAGDTHGALDRMFQDIQTFEAALGVTFAAVLHVGDLGVWPDPDRIDRATRSHDGAGDFGAWLAAGKAAPVPTVFVKGNHEDFAWLDLRRNTDVLPGLRYLGNGDTIELAHGGQHLRVVGVGGCFSPKDFNLPSTGLEGGQRAHFTKDEVERAAAAGSVDVLLLHDAPGGIPLGSGQRSYTSDAAELRGLVTRLRPRICFFGHHHARVRADLDGIPCVGLNSVGRPGHLVACEVSMSGIRVVDEYPTWRGPP